MNVFGILVVAAILTGWQLTRFWAIRLRLDGNVASRLARLMILGGFGGAAVFNFSSAGSLAGAAMAGFLYLALTRRSLRYFDAAALAFPAAWLLFRLGCAIVHDHPGAFSTHFLAVRFPDGSRWDLGLLELIATAPLAIGFFVLARRPRPPGFFSGTLAFAYGVIRLTLTGFGQSPYVAGTAVLSVMTGAAILGQSSWRRWWFFARRSF